MAAFILIPNILFVSGNPRTEATQGFLSMLTTDISQYLYIAKTLFLPGEALTTISAVYTQNFASYSFYLPFVGWGLAIAYIIHKRDWLTSIIIFCLAASFVPLFSEMFFLFTSSQMRWWFMFTLMVSLASALMIEEADTKAVGIGTIIYLCIILVLGCVIYRLNLVNNIRSFGLIVFIAVVGAIVTFILIALGKSYKYPLLLLFISTCSVLLMMNTIHTYRKAAWLDYDGYKIRYEVATKLNLPDDQYRLNETMNLISMVAHVGGFSNQSSTDTNSIRDFERLFDFYDPVSAIPKNDIPGLAEILAGKYYLSFDSNDGNYIDKIDTSYGPMYLLERDACPIGFAIDSWISTEELMNLDVTERAIALLDNAVLDKDTVTNTSICDELLQKKASDIDLNTSVSEYVGQANSKAVNSFQKDGRGFSCESNYEKDTYVYFSVPYDSGWNATIDGDKTDIIVSGGMMIIKVPSGEHEIVFSYYTPALRVGIIITMISIFIFAAYSLIRRKVTIF